MRSAPTQDYVKPIGYRIVGLIYAQIQTVGAHLAEPSLHRSGR